MGVEHEAGVMASVVSGMAGADMEYSNSRLHPGPPLLALIGCVASNLSQKKEIKKNKQTKPPQKNLKAPSPLGSEKVILK